MASPCISNGACITLSTTGSPAALTAAPVISPDPGNTLACHGNGMWAGGERTYVATGGTFPASPYDGQIVDYQFGGSGAGFGGIWSFRYSFTALRWWFIGGARQSILAGAGSVAAGATYITSSYGATGSIDLYYGGTYHIEWGALLTVNHDYSWGAGFKQSTHAAQVFASTVAEASSVVGSTNKTTVAISTDETMIGSMPSTLALTLINNGAGSQAYTSVFGFVTPVAITA